jgi:hypothetical protein
MSDDSLSPHAVQAHVARGVASPGDRGVPEMRAEKGMPDRLGMETRRAVKDPAMAAGTAPVVDADRDGSGRACAQPLPVSHRYFLSLPAPRAAARGLSRGRS